MGQVALSKEWALASPYSLLSVPPNYFPLAEADLGQVRCMIYHDETCSQHAQCEESGYL